jgi:hypothetical protein
MCKYLIVAENWLAPLRPRLPFDGRVELLQLRAICASLSRPTSRGLISSAKRNRGHIFKSADALISQNEPEFNVRTEIKFKAAVPEHNFISYM